MYGKLQDIWTIAAAAANEDKLHNIFDDQIVSNIGDQQIVVRNIPVNTDEMCMRKRAYQKYTSSNSGRSDEQKIHCINK